MEHEGEPAHGGAEAADEVASESSDEDSRSTGHKQEGICLAPLFPRLAFSLNARTEHNIRLFL